MTWITGMQRGRWSAKGPSQSIPKPIKQIHMTQNQMDKAQANLKETSAQLKGMLVSNKTIDIDVRSKLSSIGQLAQSIFIDITTLLDFSPASSHNPGDMNIINEGGSIGPMPGETQEEQIAAYYPHQRVPVLKDMEKHLVKMNAVGKYFFKDQEGGLTPEEAELVEALMIKISELDEILAEMMERERK